MNENKKTLVSSIFFIYLIVALCVIIGELYQNTLMLKVFRPMVMPCLGTLYFINSKRKNQIYIIALFFGWLTNIFYINISDFTIKSGGLSSLFFWIIITYLLLVNTRFPDLKFFGIAIIPFLFIYLYVYDLIHLSIKENELLFFIHGVIMIFLGGYTLASYFFENNRLNTYLMIAILLFTFIQFMVSIDLYYLSFKLFRPFSFLMYAVAQLIILRVILLFENNEMEFKLL